MKQKIKVVHVTSSLTTKGGGVREVVKNLANFQQAKLGFEVRVLGLQDSNLNEEKGEWETIQIHAANIIGPSSLGFSHLMKKMLLELNPDVVHLHGLWMYPSKAVLDWHRQTKKPYLISIHGMLSSVALSYGIWKKKCVSHWFQDQVFSSASALHSTSKQESSEIVEYGLQNPIYEIPNGVITPDFPICDVSSSRKVLTIGRIHKKKGLSDLLHAWAYLEPMFPDWSLEIIGPDEGGELSRLRSLRNLLSLKKVTFSGPVYGKEKYEKLAAAEIFVLPTQSENFALTVAESLACGVPVVSTKGAPWEGLVKHDCGKWVDIGVEGVSRGLLELMCLDRNDRHVMGERGRAWMRSDFSWDAISSKFVEVYDKLLINSQK